MKKSTLVLVLVITGLLLPAVLRADSPVTSTPFYEAYLDIPIVVQAKESGILTENFAEYLSSSTNLTAYKAALINALAWDFNGKDNTKRYVRYLAKKYNTPASKLDTKQLTADEVFCVGYLQVMDDYFHPEKALPILEEAAARNTNSFTVQVVYALTYAQNVFSTDWCEVWRVVERVYDNEQLYQDLRPQAKHIIYDYMVLYKEYCDK